jgi:hypothetical protein
MLPLHIGNCQIFCTDQRLRKNFVSARVSKWLRRSALAKVHASIKTVSRLANKAQSDSPSNTARRRIGGEPRLVSPFSQSCLAGVPIECASGAWDTGGRACMAGRIEARCATGPPTKSHRSTRPRMPAACRRPATRRPRRASAPDANRTGPDSGQVIYPLGVRVR